MMVGIREYWTDDGTSPFARWFNTLNAPAALKVRTALARIETGNLSNTKGVGGGVSECKIDFGPGYRVYFGKAGTQIVILLGGGIKKRQQQDIEAAQERWNLYKARKRKET